MADSSAGYIVVLRNILGSHRGIITWTRCKSKAVFELHFDDEMKKSYEVVEEGVTQERALELCRKTSYVDMVRSAVEGSTDPKTDQLNREHFRHQMDKIALAQWLRV